MTNQTQPSHGPRPLTDAELQQVQGGLTRTQPTVETEPQPSGFLLWQRQVVQVPVGQGEYEASWGTSC